MVWAAGHQRRNLGGSPPAGPAPDAAAASGSVAALSALMWTVSRVSAALCLPLLLPGPSHSAQDTWCQESGTGRRAPSASCLAGTSSRGSMDVIKLILKFRGSVLPYWAPQSPTARQNVGPPPSRQHPGQEQRWMPGLTAGYRAQESTRAQSLEGQAAPPLKITWSASRRIFLTSSSSRGEFLLLSGGDRHSRLQTASLPSRPFP